MTFGDVYNAIRNAVLSTAIYLDFVDKDSWNEHEAGIPLLTRSRHCGIQHLMRFSRRKRGVLDKRREKTCSYPGKGVTHLWQMMNKRKVLEIFANNTQWMTPDEVRIRLQGHRQRSAVYSYLFRLHPAAGPP